MSSSRVTTDTSSVAAGGRGASAGGGSERPDAPKLRGHMPALDGVRGLAVLVVLLFHFICAGEPASRFEKILFRVAEEGAHGVDLFFVLSGFLITGILVDAREKPAYFRNFYMRRFLRIFPLYYVVLVGVFFIAPLIPVFRGPDLEFLRERQGWAWLYGVNVYIAIHGAWTLKYLDHFWSLCVEEHFYFFWPLVVWWLARKPRTLMWTCLGVSIAAIVARVTGNAAGLSWWTTMVLTPFRLDGLALGGFFALLVRQPGGPAVLMRNLPRLAIAVGVLLLGTYGWVLMSSRGLTIVYPIRLALILFLLAALLLHALVAPAGSATSRFFRSPTMVFLGTYSYGLYVYHHFLSYYMLSHHTHLQVQEWLGSHLAATLAQTVVGIVITIVIAYLSYHLFEKKFLSLKRLFE